MFAARFYEMGERNGSLDTERTPLLGGASNEAPGSRRRRTATWIAHNAVRSCENTRTWRSASCQRTNRQD